MKLKKIGYWALGVAIAVDITAASLIGARHGETVSHFASRHRETWGAPICAALNVFDRDHCDKVTY